MREFSEFSEGIRSERGPEWVDPPVTAQRVTVTLSPELAAKLRGYADSHKMSLDGAAEYLLSRALDQQPRSAELYRQQIADMRQKLKKFRNDPFGHNTLDT